MLANRLDDVGNAGPVRRFIFESDFNVKDRIPTVGDVCRWMQTIAPLHLAEDWDNVGLLIGRRVAPAPKIATCLTLSPDVVANVIDAGVAMVISHHPLPFRPVAKITDDDPSASLLLDLAAAKVAVYSAHTAFDSAVNGINARWAARLKLDNVVPLTPTKDDPAVGSGRVGDLPASIPAAQLADQCGGSRGNRRVRLSGDPSATVRRVAIGCGSGGGFLKAAIGHRCNALITGEATYHTCLEARAAGVTLVMTGHFDSERFAMEQLADEIAAAFPPSEVFAAPETDVVW